MADEPTALTAKLQGYRMWQVDEAGGLSGFSARYLAIRPDNPTGTMADIVTSFSGVPAVGTSIDAERFPNMLVRGYAVEEGDLNGRRVLYIDAICSLRDPQNWDVSQFPPRAQAIQELSLTSGSVSRDFTHDAITGAMVLNSAGQPFDSVPQIDIPSPTFRKVLKVTSAQSWAQFYGKVNAANMTVAGVQYAAHQVRCVQCDRVKLWNDEFGFVEQWTIGLQMLSNMAKINGENTATEIGWDLAIVDCGTMQKNDGSGPAEGDIVPIMTTSAETGKEVAVSSPVLLDGQGYAMLEQGATPYAFRFAPYAEATFPADFYSET